MNVAGVRHFRELARKRLPNFLFQYIDGAAYGEQTYEANEADLRRITLRQRALVDVSTLDLKTNLFGMDMAMPVGLGPIGLAGMYRKRGETMAARAACRAGIPFVLSSLALCSVEEVGAAIKAPFWFQLYVVKDRGFVRDLIQRAKDSGCTAMFHTVDVPVTAVRWRDIRSGLSAPTPTLAGGVNWWWEILTHQPWAWEVGIGGKPHGCGNLTPVMGKNPKLNDYWKWVGKNLDASITWKDYDFIRENWDGPLVIKGIMDPEDARTAASMGFDGVVVTNHGGRQLDGAPSTIAQLPKIVDAAGDRLAVTMDGGVRSGTDVLKALAYGAKGVFLGRAWAYALAGAGEAGVDLLLAQIRQELGAAMAMTGVSSVGQISRQAVLDPQFQGGVGAQ
jgi:L-lactate dehydrogenase (cytochrome)